MIKKSIMFLNITIVFIFSFSYIADILYANDAEDFINNINKQINKQLNDCLDENKFIQIEEICEVYSCIKGDLIKNICNKYNDYIRLQRNLKGIIYRLKKATHSFDKREFEICFNELKKITNHFKYDFEHYKKYIKCSIIENFAIQIGKDILNLLNHTKDLSLQREIALSCTELFDNVCCSNDGYRCKKIKNKIFNFTFNDKYREHYSNDNNMKEISVKKSATSKYKIIEKYTEPYANDEVPNKIIATSNYKNIDKKVYEKYGNPAEDNNSKKEYDVKKPIIYIKKAAIQGQNLLDMFEYKQARDLFLKGNLNDYISLVDKLIQLKKNIKKSYDEKIIITELNEIMVNHSKIFSPKDLQKHKDHLRSFLRICIGEQFLIYGKIEKGKSHFSQAKFFAETDSEKEKIDKVLNDLSKGKKKFNRQYFKNIFENNEQKFGPFNYSSKRNKEKFAPISYSSKKNVNKSPLENLSINKNINDFISYNSTDFNSEGWNYFEVHNYEKAKLLFNNLQDKILAESFYEAIEMMAQEYANSNDILSLKTLIESLIENAWFNNIQKNLNKINFKNHKRYFHFMNWMYFGDYRLKEQKVIDAVENYYNAKRFAYSSKLESIINSKLIDILSSGQLNLFENDDNLMKQQIYRINQIIVRSIKSKSISEQEIHMYELIQRVDNVMDMSGDYKYKEKLSNIYMKLIYFAISFFEDQSVKNKFAKILLSKKSSWCCKSKDCKKALYRIKKLLN